MNTNSSRGRKFLILFIIAFLLMEFGGLIFIGFCYFPYKAQTGQTFAVYYNSLALLTDANSTEIIPTLGMSPVEFYNTYNTIGSARTIYCVIQFLSYAPIFVLAIIFLRKEIAEDFKSFKVHWKRNLLVIVISYAAMIYFGNIITMIYGLLGIEGESANESMINELLASDGKIFMILAVAILAPISEELIFRKLLMGACTERFRMKPVFAIIISSLIFSLIHVSDAESIKYIFQYLALAVPICCCYYFTDNNILSSIIIHAFNNTLSIVAAMVLFSI